MTTHDINIAQNFCNNILLLKDEMTLQGNVLEILNATNLSATFQHRFLRIDHEKNCYWAVEY